MNPSKTLNKLISILLTCLGIRTFYNQIFAHGSIPLMTRPTRITSKTVSLIDNIFTNFISDTSLKLKKGIIKSDESVFVSLNSSLKIHKEKQKITIHKRVMRDTNLTAFEIDLRNVHWNSINHSPETRKYETFFKTFSGLYEKHFPLKDFQIEAKELQTPWISKGLKELSKQKQKLYIKFLKDKLI